MGNTHGTINKHPLYVPAMSEYSYPTEIHTGGEVTSLSFTANGDYLISGGREGVQVWRVKDGERVTTIPVENGIFCVAVSKNGRYVAAGSEGDVLVWDATTYEQVFAVNIGSIIYDIDFSWDCLVFPYRHTATIWNIAARKKMHTLDHGDWVIAVKYSPRGDRVAASSEESIRVWDSNNGRLLADCKGNADPHCGLLWIDNHLFVETNDSKIKRIDSSTGTTISEWPVPSGTDEYACIALPQHGRFIAYSSRDNVLFQDTSTRTQLGSIPRSGESRSIAFSANDRLLAFVTQERKIIFRGSSFVTGPEICIDSAALDAWKLGQLTHAEALLTAAIPTFNGTVHHVLASRALVRARLRQWDAALVDANESIKIQSSVIGYIAKCAVLVGKGKMHGGSRACDIAFHLYSDHVTVLLLVKAVILFMAGDYEDAISRIDDLISTVGINSTLYVVQAHMYLLLGNLQMVNGDYERAIQSFEHARAKLGDRTDQPPLVISLISGWTFEDFAIAIQQRLCEALLSAGYAKKASESILRIMNQAVSATEPVKKWVSDTVRRCLSTPESNSNAAHDSNVLDPMIQLAGEWATSSLTAGTWEDALTVATEFVVPRSTIYQIICERLATTGQIADAVSCLRQMCNELAREVDGEQSIWTQDFKSQCCAKLAVLGDAAMSAQNYDEAISQYTIGLSLDLTGTNLRDLLGKRSKAHASKGEWEDALNDANKAIELDPTCPLGYESKSKVLHGIGRFGDAIDTFEKMLSTMSESSDPTVREQFRRFVTPEQTKDAIRATIKNAIRDSPAVLISAMSGRLCDKTEQAAAFESTPIFMEVVSSTTTRIDYDQIERVVGEFYRYATFSHTWEGSEPLFEKVAKIKVYDLEASPTHEKLQMFCKIVRDTGFSWAWSDTCCINKVDHVVLQEALISMFKWYQGSSMTIIFLRGVGRRAGRGAMTRSVWNSRAWTLQEYRASQIVRFYTEDWTLYLGLDVYNHKDSPEIISEMEEATGISAQALMALRPGVDSIREKLCLASTRRTTLVEDVAYSLLGIFSLSLPVTYGEGDDALGRLLAELLVRSGDMSILAWTGRSSGFNSCFPSSITVFSQLPTSHIPAPASDPNMRTITASHSLDLALVIKLYDTLHGLSAPLFVGRCIKLPCLTFKLGPVSSSRNGSEHFFRAQTDVFGTVEIRTQEDLSQLGSLYLVHPWINFLLDRQPTRNVTQTITEEKAARTLSVQGELSSFPGSSNVISATRTAWLMSRLGLLFGGRSAPGAGSLGPPSSDSPAEKRARALRLIARLRQPFGALLLAQTRENTEQYKRVASESLITVRVEELTPAILDKLICDVQVLDVL